MGRNSSPLQLSWGKVVSILCDYRLYHLPFEKQAHSVVEMPLYETKAFCCLER